MRAFYHVWNMACYIHGFFRSKYCFKDFVNNSSWHALWRAKFLYIEMIEKLSQTKMTQVVHFKYVNCMVCKLYFSKAAAK